MKKYLIIIAVLCVIKALIHFTASGNYGFHRDELLHLSVSEHLDWGFMEFPPFIAFVGKLSHVLFDYSLFGMRPCRDDHARFVLFDGKGNGGRS